MRRKGTGPPGRTPELLIWLLPVLLPVVAWLTRMSGGEPMRLSNWVAISLIGCGCAAWCSSLLLLRHRRLERELATRKHELDDSQLFLNCWGLAMAFFDRLGVRLRDVEYDAEPTPESDTFEANRTEEWVPVADPQDGDLVLFAFNRMGVATHCGVYLEGGRVLHAIGKMHSGISPYRKLRRFVTAIYRYSGVTICRS